MKDNITILFFRQHSRKIVINGVLDRRPRSDISNI